MSKSYAQIIEELQEELQELDTLYDGVYQTPESIFSLQKTLQSHNITIEDWNTLLIYINSHRSSLDGLKEMLSDIVGALEASDLVNYYNKTENDALLDTKVDKTDSANKIYGTDGNGDQTTYDKEDFGKVDDVRVNNVSVLNNKVANIDLSDYELNGNKVTSLSSSSTDTQYPSAKVVYDTYKNALEVAEGKTNTFVLSIEQTAPTTNTQAQSYKKEDGTSFENLEDFNDYVRGYILGNSAFDTNDDEISIAGMATPGFKYYITTNKVVYKVDINNTPFKVGDIFYIKELNIPDRWCSSVTFSGSGYGIITRFNALESKTDLSGYVDLTSNQTITGIKTFSGVPNIQAINTTGSINFNVNNVPKFGFTSWNIFPYGSQDLGNLSYLFKDLHLSGKIKDGNNTNYGLKSPDTTGWTANKTIATDDQTFNVINASDIAVNNVLTQAQFDLITNGKPTIVIGKLLGLSNPILFVPYDYGTVFNGYCLGIGTALDFTRFEIHKETLKIELLDTNKGFTIQKNLFTLKGLTNINDKAIPNYPSLSTGDIPKQLIYKDNNTLAWDNVSGFKVFTSSSSTLTDEMIAALKEGGVILKGAFNHHGVTYNNPILFKAQYYGSGDLWGIGFAYRGSVEHTFVFQYRIPQTNKQFAISTYPWLDLANIGTINGKTIPDYPTTNTSPQVLTISANGGNLSWENNNVFTDVTITGNITDGSDTVTVSDIYNTLNIDLYDVTSTHIADLKDITRITKHNLITFDYAVDADFGIVSSGLYFNSAVGQLSMLDAMITKSSIVVNVTESEILTMIQSIVTTGHFKKTFMSSVATPTRMEILLCLARMMACDSLLIANDRVDYPICTLKRKSADFELADPNDPDSVSVCTKLVFGDFSLTDSSGTYYTDDLEIEIGYDYDSTHGYYIYYDYRKDTSKTVLPRYNISLNDNVLTFIAANQAADKPIILSNSGGGAVINYMGSFQPISGTNYMFQFEDLAHNERWASGYVSVDLNNLTFSDLFSNTYKMNDEVTSNKVTSISSSSTNTQYPSAAAVYDFATTESAKNVRKITTATGTTTLLQLLNLNTEGYGFINYSNNIYAYVLKNYNSNTGTIDYRFMGISTKNIYETTGAATSTTLTSVFMTIPKSCYYSSEVDATFAKKEGELPFYEVASTDNVLNFISGNSVNNKLIVIRYSDGSKTTFLGKFQLAAGTAYTFQFKRFIGGDNYYSTAIDLTGKTFADLFSSTYAAATVTEFSTLKIYRHSISLNGVTGGTVSVEFKSFDATPLTGNLNDALRLAQGYIDIVKTSGAGAPTNITFGTFLKTGSFLNGFKVDGTVVTYNLSTDLSGITINTDTVTEL